jgi:cyclopropane fatty-acyl-phospholipid synthase-like methyltransferase
MPASRTENINNHFFDGHYKEIWRELIPEELTVREIDFIMQHFNLKAGNKVLDIMCGYGRHVIGLAKKGIHVTAVDNLGDYIFEIERTAKKENLPITCIETDVINFTSTEIYDLIICMGNSLNFFNEEDTIELMKTISTSIKPGGRFLVHTWSLAEIVAKNFKEKSWSYVGDFKFLTDNKYLFNPSRIEAEYFFIASDGTTEKKIGIDYIFSINEIQAMLKKFDFEIKDIYSIPGKKKFTLGEPRAYIVAEKT